MQRHRTRRSTNPDDSSRLSRPATSFGISEFSAETPTPSALVEAADAAMYESKHAGRNRVTLSSMPPRAPAAATGEFEPAPA
jgi:PleD family two-component response regulator